MFSSLEMVFRKNLEIQANEALECCKKRFMGNSGGRPENQNSKRNVDNED
jgi:hypothetical protein